MKKVILILAMILPMVCVHAQIHEEVDDFTGEKKAYTERVQIVKGLIYAFSVEFIQEGDSTLLRCYLRAKRNFTLDGGESNLYFKLSDGSVMNLVCKDDEKSSFRGKGIFKRNADFDCGLTKEDVRRLADTKATKFRLELNIGNLEQIEYEINKRHSRQLQEQASIFLEHIGK